MRSKRIVMAPFTYRVEGSLKPADGGRSKFGIYQLVDATPVEIDVLDSEDAPPVVLSVHVTDFRRRDSDILKEIRGDDAAYGANRQPAANGEGVDRMLSSFVEEFGTSTGRNWGHFLVVLKDVFDMWSVPRINRSSRFTKISSTNEDAARDEAIEHWSRNVVMIDGSLWCRVPEPVLKVMQTTQGGASIFVSEVLHIGGPDAATFRMDRLEDAKTYATRVAGENFTVGPHDLVDANGWTFDDAGYDARLVFGEALRTLAKRDDLYWTSPEFMSAALAIRDIDVSTASNASLRDALLVLRDASASIDHPQGEEIKQWAVSLVEELEWRWQQAGRDLRSLSNVEDMEAIAAIGAPRA